MAHREQPAYVMSVVDVTTSRAFSVNYTNSTGKTLFLTISLLSSVTVAGGQAIALLTGNGITNSTVVGLNAAPVMSAYVELTSIIKSGKAYRLEAFETNGTIAITKWIEAY